MTGYRTALFAALLGFSPALVAQDALARELDFVRALAEKLKFIELAQAESEHLAKEYRSAGDQDRIAQLSVQISFYGAKARGERTLQRQLFKEAMEKSKELIERSSDQMVLLQARGTLADASQEFGQFLIEELEIARENNPDVVKELEEEAAEVFRSGIEACRKVKSAYELKMSSTSGVEAEQNEIRFGLFWMRMGVLMREQGRAVKADREVLVNRAIEELTEMVLHFGEETAIGLKGLFEIGQCYEVLEDMFSALDLYTSTIDQISKSLEDAADIGLPGDVQALMFEMMQQVYVRTGETMLRDGDPAAEELFTKFRENMAEFGEEGVELFQVVDPRWGHLMLLAESRFLAESGDPAKVQDAIAMVQRINSEHPRDYVGIRAKAALGAILQVNTSLVSGDLLLEIAKGEFFNKNYEAAVKGFRRAIAAMTPTESASHGLEAWDMLGTAFYRSDRFLEAMLSLSEALERHGEGHEEDTPDISDRLDLTLRQFKRQSKGDPAFDTLTSRAQNLVEKFVGGLGEGKVHYKAGSEAFRNRNYARAIESFSKVPEEYVFFETAKVRIAKALVSAGDLPNAKKTLETYAAYRAQKAFASHESGKVQARQGAVAEADFLEAQIAYWEARGNETLKVEKNPTNYPQAIEKMRAYISAHGDDATNAPIAAECLGRLHCDIGEMDKAEQAYAELKGKDSVRASRLASEIFIEYTRQEEAIAKEHDQAIAAGADESTVKAGQRAVDAVREKIGALGLDYIKNSVQPQLAVMVNTMTAFKHLEEWNRVDEVARQTLESFGTEENAAIRKVIDLTVRPMIGEALLQQGKFTDAYKMLTEAEEANPEQWELKRQISRCLGGWFVINKAGAPVREPALDRPDEAYDKYYQEYRKWALRPGVEKYDLEWYRFHWECYWFCKQAGEKDTEFKARAAKFYRLAKSFDNFEKLKSHGAEGLKLYDYFRFNQQ